jgi:hypothetical protein
VLIEFVFTIIFFISMVILNFAIFRINVRRNFKQIVILALIIGTANYYFKFVLVSQSFLINQILIYIIALVVLRRYPVLYAFIFALTGSIAVSLIDTIVTIAALQLGLSTMDSMIKNMSDFVILHLITTVLCLLVTFVIYKARLGFAFVSSRFSGRQAIKRHNFVWAALLVFGFLSLQFGNISFTAYSLHVYIIILIGISLMASIIFAYLQNQQLLKDILGDTYEKFKG